LPQASLQVVPQLSPQRTARQPMLDANKMAAATAAA
jgi:hypothetical protein